MSYFYFVLTNTEAFDLLQEELLLRYPDLRKSYSRPGFMTLKSEKSIPFKAHFSRLYGVSLGQKKREELNYDRAWVWKREEDLIIPPDLKKLSENSMFKIGEKVTLIMLVGPDEYWVGEYELKRTHFQTPGEESSIIERDDVPSRAYYKLAELYEAYDLPFDHQERVLELGSAPGGASLFLLEQDLLVLGVDPAEMDPAVKKKYGFRHLKIPFEHLSQQHLNDDVDWIISDVNLPPSVVIKEVERLLDFLSPKGILLTLKMNDSRQLQAIPDYLDRIRKFGYKVELKYVPSFRREIALIALKDL
jgi:23S rRNA (cytidine2498-2'-O)-methyltransferase